MGLRGIGIFGLLLFAASASADLGETCAPDGVIPSGPAVAISSALEALDPQVAIPTPYLYTSNSPHQVRILDEAAGDLELRLQMIEKAQESIDLEYYVFRPDHVGRAILQALVRKARAGVKVRILVDYYNDDHRPGIDPYLAEELRRAGIEVKYFNKANLAQFWKVGFRSHRKIFVVDGSQMVMGGRNLADSYFGMDDKANYMDRDVWVRGAVVKAARETMDFAWSSASAVDAETPEFPVSAKVRAQAERASSQLVETPADREFRREVAELGSAQLLHSPVASANSVTFFSDGPTREERHSTPYIQDLLSGAKSSVEIENYIYLPDKAQSRMMHELREKGVSIEMLTNGGKSMDSRILPVLAYPSHRAAVKDGIEIHSLSSKPLPSEQLLGGAVAENSRWATHAKSMVLDEKDVLIGSYNFDPRSANINVEAGVVIHDSPQMAKIVADSIDERITGVSKTLGADGRYRPLNFIQHLPNAGPAETEDPMKGLRLQGVLLWPIRALLKSQF